jgi:hypothetical protein
LARFERKARGDPVNFGSGRSTRERLSDAVPAPERHQMLISPASTGGSPTGPRAPSIFASKVDNAK